MSDNGAGWMQGLYGFSSVSRKEFIHLTRDRATLVIALMIPVIQLIIFGYAINLDVRHISTIVVDMDRSRESRAYIQSLVNTRYIDATQYGDTPKEAESALRKGTARVAVIIPPDFSRRSVPGGNPSVRVLIDGSDSQIENPARMAFLKPSNTSAGSVDARINILYNPQVRTAIFMIPGLIGTIMQIVVVSLTSFTLVREREQGTLEQLMVTPVGRLGLMVGKLLPYALLALLEMVAVLWIGSVVFDVQPVGSLPLLMLMSIPFIIATLALGLLISTIAQNQSQALQLTLLITLPSILMSGFAFPRETMPGALYLISDALPVTYFLVILRGVIVRGAGLADLWNPLAALMTIATILISISVSRFHKSIA
jgi:ABC-2 type transport system permease protein